MMNKKLLDLNKQFVDENALYKQQVVEGINEEYDTNDQLAIIFNVLEELIEELPNSTHKDELAALLNLRNQVKNSAK